MKKRFLLNWAIWLSIGLAFFSTLLFLNPTTVSAVDRPISGDKFTLDAEWVDRAHIKVNKFVFKDEGQNKNSILSDKGNNEGVSNVNARLAAVIVGKTFTADNISADEGDSTSFFLDTGCGDNKSKFYIEDTDRERNGIIKKNVVKLHNNDLWIQGVQTGCFNPIAKANPVEDRVLEFFPANFDNAKIYYQQKSGSTGTLSRVDNNADEEVAQDPVNKKVYSKQGPGNCKITVTFIGEPANGDRNVADYHSCGGQFADLNGIFVKITKAEDVNASPNPNDTTGANPDTGCEVQLLNPLTWLMCPIIEGGILAVRALDNAITEQLTVSTTGSDSLFDEEKSEAGKALFNTWASFRYISLGILVIVGLVMIISQALSFGVFDAYTIKKVLPKILIGVIGISVSWYLCKFAIELFNDLGIAVRSLLYGPFKDLPGAKFDAGPVSLLTIGAGVLVLGLGIIGILSFIATALLAVIIAFGILVFRRVLIILLVVTAPIAIVCWILPNTERVWKMWWDFFIRSLVVFPIIALFIAGGRVIAQIATLEGDSGGGNTFLASTVAFIAYFGPYFALPAAFRLAGGAIATVGGLANDRSRGVFDRLSQGRKKRASSRFQRATNGGLYATPTKTKIDKDGNARTVRTFRGKLGNIGNKAAGVAFEPHNYGALYGSAALGGMGWKNNPLARKSSEIMSKIGSAVVDETQEAQQHVNKLFNDKGYQALTGVHNFSGKIRGKEGATVESELRSAGLWGAVPQSYKDIQKFGEILSQSDEATEARGGKALMADAGYLSSLRGSDSSTQASIAGIGALGWAQHGFIDPDSLAQIHNNLADSPGAGPEIAGLLTTRAQLLGQDKAGDIKLGYADIPDPNNPHHIKSVYASPKRTAELIKSHKQHDFAQFKAGTVKREAWETAPNMNEDGTYSQGKIRDGGIIDLATRASEEFKHDEDDVKAMQQKIMVNMSAYNGDEDSRKAWRQAAEEVDRRLGRPPGSAESLVAQSRQADEAYAQAQAFGRAGGPPAPGDPLGPAGPQPPSFS